MKRRSPGDVSFQRWILIQNEYTMGYAYTAKISRMTGEFSRYAIRDSPENKPCAREIRPTSRLEAVMTYLP